MSANVERVLNEIKALTPEERQQVRAALDRILLSASAVDMQPFESRSPMTEEEFEQMLVEKGVLGEISPPLTDSAAYGNRRAIEILDGKPVSETLIEERR
jgi:hypothetical protein